MESGGKPGLGDTIQMARTISYVDEYPDLVPGPFALKYAVVHVGLAAASFIGWALGYEPWLKEYTPEYLWDVASTRGASTRDKKKI